MIETVINFIETYLVEYGVFGVALAGFFEELIAPLPSPVVMTASGFFFLEGVFSLSLVSSAILLVALPYAIGMLLASLIIYALGRFAGRPVIDRWGRFFGISWRDVERLQSRLKDSRIDEWSLFGLRIIPLVPSVAIALFCGFIRMNIFKYSIITLLGVMVRGVIFSLLGWYMGLQYLEYAEMISRFESLLMLLVAVVIFAFLVYFIRIKNFKS